MWTSYEALCELGALDLDPTSVFGVRPAELDQFNDQLQKEHEVPEEHFPLQERSVLGQSFPSSHQTPFGATKPIHAMDVATPSSAGSIPKASLFQTAHKSNTRKGTALQFETPNLTPIPIQDASFAHHHHHQQHHQMHHQYVHFAVDQMDHNASVSFVDSTNPDTIRRAKHVAARLYYPPSPETPDSAHLQLQMDGHSRYLRGMGRSTMLSFTSAMSEDNVSETPVRRGGIGSTSRLGGGRDSMGTARKPRALFLTSENKTDNTDEPEADEDDEPDMEDDQQQGDTQTKPATTIKTSRLSPDPSAYFAMEDQVADEHSGVQDILELLCMLGAAWWRLCQVCCASKSDRCGE
jgi:hypothetical protein